jgi:hypothetical protein
MNSFSPLFNYDIECYEFHNLTTNMRIAKVVYGPLLTNKLLSTIPSKSKARNKRQFLRKNVI